MMPLKDRIAEAMRRHPKLSQADIARACGVKTPSVADWLNGKTKSLAPKPARLAAALFGCDQNWIGSGIGLPNWLDSQHPSGGADAGGGVARDLSLSRFDDVPTITLGTNMNWNNLPPLFKLAVTDTALSSSDAASLDPGDMVILSRRHLPRGGKVALVTDTAGNAYLREYEEGRAGQWRAVARRGGYRPLESAADGLTVVATMVGRLDADWDSQ